MSVPKRSKEAASVLKDADTYLEALKNSSLHPQSIVPLNQLATIYTKHGLQEYKIDRIVELMKKALCNVTEENRYLGAHVITNLIRAYALLQRPDKALSVSKSFSVDVADDGYYVELIRLASNEKELNEIFSRIKEEKAVSIRLRSCLAKKFAEIGKKELGITLFTEKIDEIKDTASFSAFLTVCDTENAVRALNMLQNQGTCFQPDHTTFTALMTHFLEINDIERFKKVVQSAKQWRIRNPKLFFSPTYFNLLLKTVEHSLVLYAMKDLDVHADIITLHTLLFHASYTKDFGLFQKYVTEYAHITPTASVLYLVVSTMEEFQRYEIIERTFNYAKRTNTFSFNLYTALLRAFIRTKNHKFVKQMLNDVEERIQKETGPLNYSYFCLLLSAYDYLGMSAEFERTLLQMPQNSIQIFNHLLLLHTIKKSRSEYIESMLLKMKPKFTSNTFCRLIEYGVATGNIPLASRYKIEIEQDKNFSWTSCTCLAVATYYTAIQCDENLESLIEEHRDCGLDSRFFNYIFKHYLDSKAFDKVNNLIAKMQDLRVIYDRETYKLLLQYYLKVDIEAYKVWKRIMKERGYPE
jgi:hypothetical protein